MTLSLHRPFAALAALVATALLLGACASSPDKPTPSALVDYKEQLSVSRLWSAQIGPVSSPLTSIVGRSIGPGQCQWFGERAEC